MEDKMNHEKCECHKCNYLRASQLDRWLSDKCISEENVKPKGKKPSDRLNEVIGNGANPTFKWFETLNDILDEQWQKTNSPKGK